MVCKRRLSTSVTLACNPETHVDRDCGCRSSGRSWTHCASSRTPWRRRLTRRPWSARQVGQPRQRGVHTHAGCLPAIIYKAGLKNLHAADAAWWTYRVIIIMMARMTAELHERSCQACDSRLAAQPRILEHTATMCQSSRHDLPAQLPETQQMRCQVQQPRQQRQ